jgi:hypothetical protein
VKRVWIICTGKMEFEGLARSLGRVFPAHFEAVAQLDSFTSAQVQLGAPLQKAPLDPRQVPVDAREVKLAAALVGAILGDKAQAPFDLILVLDDLETCNQHQIDVVTQRFGAAVRFVLERFDAEHGQATPDRVARLREDLRARASFHLARPMAEAWFFGHPDTLTEAGASRMGEWPCQDDAERFQVDDADYRRWPRYRSHVLGDQHPKDYLTFLCGAGGYREVPRLHQRHQSMPSGRAALEQVDWRALARRPGQFGLTRAMLHDIADALEVQDWPPAGLEPTARMAGGGTILRNL